jgi:hypothetical protein
MHMLLRMDEGHEDLIWDAFVTAILATGKAHERQSRYGDKPAVYIGTREVAHLEAAGTIDLRITRQGWSRVKDEYGGDPTLHHEPSRRDWIELRPRTPEELKHLAGLLTVAIDENG